MKTVKEVEQKREFLLEWIDRIVDNLYGPASETEGTRHALALLKLNVDGLMSVLRKKIEGSQS